MNTKDILKLMIFVIFMIIIIACKSKSFVKPFEKVDYIVHESYLIDTICNKLLDATCETLLNCHYSKFLETPYPFIYDKIDKKNDIGDLLTCAVQINSKRDKYFEITNNILNHYYLTNFKKSKINNGGTLISGVHMNNRFYNILSNWNTKESFNICMLYVSKNVHDSMGHGDCSNHSIEFFNHIVLPKIKSVAGLDFWTYFEKNTPNADHGPADCYDSLYEALYNVLKQAWEEGKIELKDAQNNK